MILTKKNLLFVHIEKTGGNSLSQLMKKYSDDQIFKHSGHSDGYETFEIKGEFTRNKHQDLENYKQLLGDNFDKFKFFTITRNPLDRLISAYYMRDRSLHPNFFIRKINHFTKKRLNFFLFNHTYYRNIRPSFSYDKFLDFIKNFKNQTDYFLIKNKFIYPDFIIRFENYKEDVENFCKKFKIEYENIHVNKSDKKKFSDSEMKYLEKLVLSTHHKKDYETFNYSFLN